MLRRTISEVQDRNSSAQFVHNVQSAVHLSIKQMYLVQHRGWSGSPHSRSDRTTTLFRRIEHSTIADAHLCDPSTKRAIPKRFCDEVYLIRRRYIACPFTVAVSCSPAHLRGCQVKLCDPSTTRAVHERLCDEVHLVKRPYIKCLPPSPLSAHLMPTCTSTYLDDVSSA